MCSSLWLLPAADFFGVVVVAMTTLRQLLLLIHQPRLEQVRGPVLELVLEQVPERVPEPVLELAPEAEARLDPLLNLGGSTIE